MTLLEMGERLVAVGFRPNPWGGIQDRWRRRYPDRTYHLITALRGTDEAQVSLCDAEDRVIADHYRDSRDNVVLEFEVAMELAAAHRPEQA